MSSGVHLGYVDGINRRRLFGLDFVDIDSLGPVVNTLMKGIADTSDRLPVLVTPNVDILVHLHQNPDSPEASLAKRARFCLPDGQPVVLASRLLGKPLSARLPGSSLFEILWPRLAADKVDVLVLASSQAVADGLASEHPSARYLVAPFISDQDSEAIERLAKELIVAIEETKPKLVFIGIGNPKDSILIDAVLKIWQPLQGDAPIFLALGASFNMYLRIQKRAPLWIQGIWLEWFYRFLQEPRRLFHRYFVRAVPFLGIVWREYRSLSRR